MKRSTRSGWRKKVVVSACHDPMQLVILDDQQLLFIERAGAVKLVDVGSGGQATSIVVGEVPVAVYGEVGLLGIAADPSYAQNGWLYLFHCPADKPHTMRLSRFTLRDRTLELDSEVRLLEYAIDAAGAIHMGGGLWMDAAGDLWIGTGDNCPPIPELPVDVRRGRENFDAFRTSANTQDLRGKILRIHPEADGSYSIPRGNLFADQRVGRREIYAMGCRNPFRLAFDDETRAVMWGDVGPNIDVNLDVGPNGYDEFHRATEPGHFGWPHCVGPNEAYRAFDFATRRPGDLFDLQSPLNRSPNNTGSEQLPSPQPAVIWYPSTDSSLFPTLGSGGRSAMSGPVYRYPATSSGTGMHLHERFQGRWFIYDWTRNWIQTVMLDASGAVEAIEPFMPTILFRKPIDMKVGADGSLFVIEFGDKWGDNRDAQLTRIVYRRGNRRPTARMVASRLAGREPLHVRVDADTSSDPDGDPLRYRWELNGKELTSTTDGGSKLELTLTERGSHRLRLTVSDDLQTLDHSELQFQVGNEPPQVAITSPLHGSFFEWGDTLHYQVQVVDHEDGSTDLNPAQPAGIPSARVITSYQPLTRRSVEEAWLDPGLAAMRKTTCFSCHTTKAASAGPSYDAVSRKYLGADDEAIRKLAAKIVSGGTGVWGDKPMPAHPQHTLAETQQMVRWILSLATSTASPPQPGQYGFFRTTPPVGSDPSMLELTAEYTDNGVSLAGGSDLSDTQVDTKSENGQPDIPPLRSEAKIVLHAHRKRAAFADHTHQVSQVDVFEGGIGLVARLAPSGWLAFDDLRLDEIDRISFQLQHVGEATGRLVLRENSQQGRQVGAVDLTPKARMDASEYTAAGYTQTSISITPSPGLTDLYVVFESNVLTAGDQPASQVTPHLNLGGSSSTHQLRHSSVNNKRWQT
ncbi:MAG: PQQ-dependent sugar dehydrogenase [Pirellulaceae bacterium]